ncbi:TetR/AcrR family transcriptional regulator [Anaeromicropila herbilytica]|uniref:TetR family transcriptional regulator n=1 Tax=Anaeromicropila herbilytica TaxID=2785025 RepID=A0A7R7EM16_9FIRM|nr:TetR/AcrR family transcriptional regulator [Anaeromicropila herbilytica]BCN31055.1 TetR family transcriptional regulator [Anaeromicropila herbilytica]
MIINGTEDLRIQKTIDAIHKTFEDMICEMNYDKITVKELTDRARINKKTFYRYYPSMDDLLIELQNEMSQEYIARVASYSLPEELDKVNREFFLYSLDRGEVYEKITCSGNYQFMRQKMISNVMNNTWGQSQMLKSYDRYKQNILLAFVQTSSVEMYRQWVADGKKVPINEIITLSNHLLCDGVNGLMKTLND